jgi:hypothetical protein
MELLLSIESKNLQKAKEILLKDDVVSRASITWKDAKSFGGKEGYYIYVSGLEEACKKAVELSKDFAKEIKGKEKEKFIKRLKDEEDKAAEGMGGIFG